MTAPSFSLWSDPWIRTDRGLVSIQDVLLGDGRYQLSGMTPFEDAGVMRLLTAICIDAVRPGGPVSELPAADIERWAAQYAHRLDLFGERPFLQAVAPDIPQTLAAEADYKASSPVGRIFPLVPTGSSVVLGREREDDHKLCPACAARGLTIPGPFYSAGGVGYRKSVNGVPPVYCYPVAGHLKADVAAAMCWPEIFGGDMGYDDPLVPWRYEGDYQAKVELKSASLLLGLVFLPRRIRLYPEPGGVCTSCGARTSVLIRRIHFSQGQSLFGEQLFVDPYVITKRIEAKGKTWEKKFVPAKTLAWQDVPVALLEGFRSPLMAARSDVSEWRFYGAGNDKAKYYYVFGQRLAYPAGHLADGFRFTSGLIFLASRILKDATRKDFSAHMWEAVYRPFQIILVDSSPEQMIPWEQDVVDTILDLHWRLSRNIPRPLATKNEMALMAWIRDHRKWRDPAEPPDEPGIGKRLKRLGMRPQEFLRLLEEGATRVKQVLAEYRIDGEAVDEAMARWGLPGEFIQRAWLRDYFHIPSEKDKETL